MYLLDPAAVGAPLAARYEAEVLSPDERASVAPSANVAADERHRRVLARALVRHTLAAYHCGGAGEAPPSPRSLAFATGERGKPQLAPSGGEGARGSGKLPQPQLEFSLAHTRSLLALAVAPRGVRVGVDVERVGREPRRGVMRLARRWFAQAEVDALEALGDEAERARRFMELWTLKEAYVKALGAGIAGAPLNTFEVAVGDGAQATATRIALRDEQARCGGDGGALRLLAPDESHVASLCVLGAGTAPAVSAYAAVPLEGRERLELDCITVAAGHW